ncbi:MAG: PSD1 and planctomycete cytochrome C domain-containing protein [Planctomycetaceae bacterium]
MREKGRCSLAIGWFAWCCLCPLGIPALATAQESDVAFFESRIRSLLIKHCLECHGPKKQESGLRLDTRDGWVKGGDRGLAIVPGKPEKSLFITAVRYADKDLQMPPDGKKLSAAQVADLVAWVKKGAPDPRRANSATPTASRMSLKEARTFWSFRPVKRPPLPKVKHEGWVKRPLDAFIGAKLEEKGLVPVDEASKRTLIRRATLDLTGLPPTLAEIQAFLNDESQQAFKTLTDRLLATSAYGERWGRHWLDVARYADTAGDGADYPVREAGKYRNWVIDAFNADQPFDQFIRDQIAGDILARSGPASEYASRVTATGFLAIGKRYGYSPKPDYQHLDFADVIDSVGRSLLGLSLGCARCHDHKYDPVTSADYYALYGIFQSTKWAFPGGEEHKRPAHFPPLVPPNEVVRLTQVKAKALARLDDQIAHLTKEQETLNGKSFAGGFDLGFESQPLGKPPTSPWLSEGPNAVIAEAQSPLTHTHPAGKRGVRVGSGLATDGVRYVFKNGLRAAPGKQMHFTIDFRTVAPAKRAGAFRFYLGRGVIQSLAVECSVTAKEIAIRNGAKWEIVRVLVPGTWYTLRLTLDPAKKTYSGVVGKPGDLTAFQDKQLGLKWDGVADTFICDAFGHVKGPSSARDLDNIGLQEAPFGVPGSGPVKAPQPPPNSKERLGKIVAELAALTKRRKADAAQDPYQVAYGVSEGTPANARIQRRGEPDKLGDEVPRRFLEVLGGDPLPQKSSGSGRLQLAHWLTRPTNPLTARVFVNRVWQWHFGRGLVATASDFGSRGVPPTHPELLDWLTSEFVASGWSVKSLHRLIMQSRTYQLASDDNAANLKSDPSNQWLWRYSRRPLDAESIRDAMLAVSGKLDRSRPVSHPFPPVQTWGFTIHRPFHAVYDSNHRSVFLMVQRNRRHPFLAQFDAADPNLSVAKRQPSITPTQALFLMNSPFVHEQSRAFAGRLLAASKDDATRVRLAFETAHGSKPSPSQITDALAFVTAYRKQLDRRGIQSDRQSEAAWAALARVLLTSNAFLYAD